MGLVADNGGIRKEATGGFENHIWSGPRSRIEPETEQCGEASTQDLFLVTNLDGGRGTRLQGNP